MNPRLLMLDEPSMGLAPVLVELIFDIVKLLNEIPGITCPEPQGAFYAYPSVKGVLGKTLRGTTIDSSSALANVVLDEAEVAVVPGEAFGTPGYLRMSYALGDDDIVEGVTRMAKLLAGAQ
jgi:aspartate/methionine/tyrosine aminotransferase